MFGLELFGGGGPEQEKPGDKAITLILDKIKQYREGEYNEEENKVSEEVENKSLADYPDLAKDIAGIPPEQHSFLVKELINKGEGMVVLDNFKLFQGIDPKEVLGLLIDEGFEYAIPSRLESIPLSAQEVAEILVDKKMGEAVIDHINYFTNIDYQKMIDLLLKKGEARRIADNLDKLSKVIDREDIEYLFLDNNKDLNKLSSEIEQEKKLKKSSKPNMGGGSSSPVKRYFRAP